MHIKDYLCKSALSIKAATYNIPGLRTLVWVLFAAIKKIVRIIRSICRRILTLVQWLLIPYKIARQYTEEVLFPYNPWRPKFSAYLSIYNDWDILEAALKSVAPYVDELVVVDGAYDWMVPYLKGTGSNPLCSDERVYNALRSCGIPFRVINRTWSNEVEKRMAGYQACKHRYIFRVDADEIIFFNNKDLIGFLQHNAAIAEMEMPLYAAPGWIVRRKDLKEHPRQGFLFDRNQIPADIHLNYLWLVLTVDDLPTAGHKPHLPYDYPIAFNAHLTNWRTADTAVNRAAFYIMNWMRQNGVSWLSGMENIPVTNFDDLFNKVSAKEFKNALSSDAFSAGTWNLRNNEVLEATPLSLKKEKNFIYLYKKFHERRIKQNLESTQTSQMIINGYSFFDEDPRHASQKTKKITNGESIFFDISNTEAREVLSLNQDIKISFSMKPIYAKIILHSVSTQQPMYETKDLTTKLDDKDILFSLPPLPPVSRGTLSEVIELICAWHGDTPIGKYRVRI